MRLICCLGVASGAGSGSKRRVLRGVPGVAQVMLPAVPSGVHVRPMQANELEAAALVEAQSYPASVVEGIGTLRHHFDLFPSGCFVATLSASPRAPTVGYILSCPWCRSDVPMSLHDQSSLHIPTDADTYYVHDLCVLPHASGRRVGKALLRRCLAVPGGVGGAGEAAAGRGGGGGGGGGSVQLTTSTLTSVNGSVAFWARQGYQVVPPSELTEAGRQSLQTYCTEGGAVVMAMPLV